MSVRNGHGKNSIAIKVRINGETREWTIAPGDLLLDVLRREGLWGVKRGCETGECGACAVLLDGEPINSCLMFAAQADGREMLTIEGVAARRQARSGAAGLPRPRRGPVRLLHAGDGALRQGAARALADPDRGRSPRGARRRLCRCTGYKKPVEAVLAAAGRPRPKPRAQGGAAPRRAAR